MKHEIFQNPKLVILPLLFFANLLFTPASSQASKETAPLFRDFSVIKVTLKAPFAEMLNFDRKNYTEAWSAKSKFISGQLQIDGHTIPVEIRLRGYTSLSQCSFPKLMLKFPKDSGRPAALGTIFEDIAKLDLNTHCRSNAEIESEGPTITNPFSFMKENHSEALVYKWAEILGITTLRARPALITYIDSSNSIVPIATTTEQAFFIEHFSSFLKRVNGSEIRHSKDLFHPRDPTDEKTRYEFVDFGKHPQLDQIAYAKMAMFETLIGNYDWRINDHELWNVRIFEDPRGQWVTVPLDFNFTTVAMGMGTFQIIDPSPLASISKKSQAAILSEFRAKQSELITAAAFLPMKRQEFLRSRLEDFFKHMTTISTSPDQ